MIPIRIPLFNATYTPEIRTVLLHHTDWEFSLPVIEAGSSQRLSFVSTCCQRKARTSICIGVVQCRMEKSDLLPEEYLSGFGNGTIRNPPFLQYHLWLHPLSVGFSWGRMHPLLSGNYALVVYEQDNPEKILLSRRFYVVENKVQIEAVLSSLCSAISKKTGTAGWNNSIA